MAARLRIDAPHQVGFRIGAVDAPHEVGFRQLYQIDAPHEVGFRPYPYEFWLRFKQRPPLPDESSLPGSGGEAGYWQIRPAGLASGTEFGSGQVS